MNGTLTRINGIDLYHEVHGTGPALVVLHGGVLNAQTCFGAMNRRHRSTRVARRHGCLLMLELFPDAQLAVLPDTTHCR